MATAPTLSPPLSLYYKDSLSLLDLDGVIRKDLPEEVTYKWKSKWWVEVRLRKVGWGGDEGAVGGGSHGINKQEAWFQAEGTAGNYNTRN